MNTLATKDALEAAGVEITHAWTLPEGARGTWYFKISQIKAGASLEKHTHTYDHPSFLVCGDAVLEVDDASAAVSGPSAFLIEAGKRHRLYAKTDLIWICAHQTDDTNPDTVDISLMSKKVGD